MKKKSETEWWMLNLSDKNDLYELIKRELDERNHACGKALDILWKAMLLEDVPDYGDWEYAAQAARHILARYRELQSSNRHLKEKNRKWIENTRPYLHHWHSCTWQTTAKCSCGLNELLEQVQEKLL